MLGAVRSSVHCSPLSSRHEQSTGGVKRRKTPEACDFSRADISAGKIDPVIFFLKTLA